MPVQQTDTRAAGFPFHAVDEVPWSSTDLQLLK